VDYTESKEHKGHLQRVGDKIPVISGTTPLLRVLQRTNEYQSSPWGLGPEEGLLIERRKLSEVGLSDRRAK